MNKWKRYEVKILKAAYAKLANGKPECIHDLDAKLNRTIKGIYSKADRLGISQTLAANNHKDNDNRNQDNRWTPQEMSILTQVYATSSWDNIMILLPGRSKRAAVTKANCMRLSRPRRKGLRPRPCDVAIRKYYPNRNWIELDKIKGMTRQQIMSRANHIGLATPLAIPSQYWTQKELKKLAKVYPTAKKQQLITLFPGRGYYAIRAAAKRHNIKRSISATNKIT